MYLHRCKDANLKIMVLSPPCYESQNIQMQTLKAIYVITLYNCELALPTKENECVSMHSLGSWHPHVAISGQHAEKQICDQITHILVPQPVNHQK